MASPAEMDPEGYILEKAREILGEDIPIVTSMDLHGIVTDRMLKHSDAIVVYHTYPHVDQKETGERSARLLMRLLREQLKPVTVRVRVPALVRGDELITDSESTASVFDWHKRSKRVMKIVRRDVYWESFTDVPELCTIALS